MLYVILGALCLGVYLGAYGLCKVASHEERCLSRPQEEPQVARLEAADKRPGASR